MNNRENLSIILSYSISGLELMTLGLELITRSSSSLVTYMIVQYFACILHAALHAKVTLCFEASPGQH